MKQSFLFTVVLALTAVVFLGACGGDDDPGPACGANFNYAISLQDEATALSNAATTYANDPTTVNCQAYVQSVEDYLDAAEDIDNCVPQADRAAYQQAIDDARDELAMVQC